MTDDDIIPVAERSPFTDRRLGSFAIPVQWLEGMQNRHAEVVFKNFRIVRAEIDYASGSVLYVAASELFDPVPIGAMAPGYRVMVDPDGDTARVRVVKL